MLRELKSPRGPRVLSILLGVLLLTHVTLADHHGNYDKDDHHQTEQEHKDEDYHKITDRLDHVTARLEHLDHHLDKRLSPKIRQKAQSLDHHLSKFEDDHCDEHHYDCGGQDHECVSKLFVCDGHKDCRNGGDESHCTLPTKAGDTFDGFQVYDHCDEGHFKRATMTIYEVQVRPAFPGFPLIKAIIKSAEDDKKNHVEVAYHLFGYYRFSTNRLVLFPPPGTEAGEDTGILCEFDGHNLDRCEAYVVNKVSLNRCAKFVFYRDRSHKRGGKDDHHDDEEHH